METTGSESTTGRYARLEIECDSLLLQLGTPEDTCITCVRWQDLPLQSFTKNDTILNTINRRCYLKRCGPQARFLTCTQFVPRLELAVVSLEIFRLPSVVYVLVPFKIFPMFQIFTLRLKSHFNEALWINNLDLVSVQSFIVFSSYRM